MKIATSTIDHEDGSKKEEEEQLQHAAFIRHITRPAALHPMRDRTRRRIPPVSTRGQRMVFIKPNTLYVHF